MLILALLICSIHNSYAQYPSMLEPTSSLDKASGLPDVYITCMEKDDMGYMWIGTRTGLCRYDGTHLKTWFEQGAEEGGLSSNWIISLHFDEKRNRLWVGTSKGLDFLDLETYRFTYPPSDTSGKFNLNTEWITGVFSNSNEDFWIYNIGLHHFDAETEVKTTYVNDFGDQANLITLVIADNQDDDILWMATMYGYLKFNQKTKSFIDHYFYSTDNNKDQNRLNQVELCLFQDQGGLIYGGGLHGGLTTLDPKTGKVTLFNPLWNGVEISDQIHFKSIIPLKHNILSIGTSEGMIWYNTNTKEVIDFKKNELYNSKTITPYLKDDQERIWISSNPDGIDIYDPYLCQFQVFDFDADLMPTDLVVIKMVEDTISDKLFFIQKYNNEVYQYDIKNSKFETALSKVAFNQKEEINTVDILINKENKLLMLGKSQVYQYSDKGWLNLQKAPLLEVPPYTTFLEGKKDDLFLLSIYKGMYRVNMSTNVIRHYGISCFYENGWWISDAFYDSRDRLWVNHLDYGFSVFDIENDTCQIVRIDKDKPQNINRIKDHIWLQDSLLMVCGGSQGLALLHRDSPEKEMIYRFKVGKKGMVSDEVYSLEYDHSGNIWMLCARGLQKYDPAKDQFTFYSYPNHTFYIKTDVNDQDILYCLADGRMVFSTGRSLVFFDPKKLYENKEEITPVLASISVFNTFISRDKFSKHEMKFKYDENFFTFNFSAIGFTSPAEMQFKYRLNGVDDKWVNSQGLSQIKYAHLLPGKYRFELMAANSDERWNDEIFSLEFIILSPWWKTSWAYVLYCVIGISALFLWYQNRKKKWELSAELSLQKVKIGALQKQKELDVLNAILTGEEKERMRLSRELHDSVGAMIASVKMYFQTIFRDSPELKNNKTFIQTDELITRTYNEVRTISHNLMPMDVLEQGLVQAVRNLCKNFTASSKTDYECQFFFDNEAVSKEIELNLYRIIQEMIKNISLHANAKKVLLQLNADHESIHLEIENDGALFDIDEALAKKGMGFQNIKMRVELLKGELDLISNNKMGTVYSVLIPLENKKIDGGVMVNGVMKKDSLI